MSSLYDVYKKAILDQIVSVDIDTDTIRARLVTDSVYTANYSTDTTLTPITKYVGTTDQAMTCTVSATGVVDMASTITFASVAYNAGDADGVVIFKFVTDDAGSTPIVHLDFATAVTPNGGDIVVDWNGSGLFAL